MPKSRGRATKKRARPPAKTRRTSASRVPGSGTPAGVIVAAAAAADDRGRAARVRGPIDAPHSGAGRSGPTEMGSGVFPMRILPRATSHGRTATMALAGLALVASVALASAG